MTQVTTGPRFLVEDARNYRRGIGTICVDIRRDMRRIIPNGPGIGSDVVAIEVKGAASITGQARHTYESKVSEYAEDLLKEASRYEVAHRANTSLVPQYTTGQIFDANNFVRRQGLPAPRPSKFLIAIKILEFFAVITAGVTSNLMLQENPWILPQGAWMALFCISATSAVLMFTFRAVQEFWGRGG